MKKIYLVPEEKVFLLTPNCPCLVDMSNQIGEGNNGDDLGVKVELENLGDDLSDALKNIW